MSPRVVGVFLVAISIVGVALMQQPPQTPVYNVVFITVETLRADHVGAYGYHRNTTPNIDALAEESIVFTNATSPSATTILSMPAVFTSLYPRTDRVVYENISRTPAWRSNLSLIRQIQEAGYHTGAIVAHEYVKARWGFDRFFDHFDDDFVQGVQHNGSINRTLPEFQFYKRYWEERNAAETTDLATSFLRNTEQPFFLWLHYFDPHQPYMPPEKKYIEMFRTPFRGPNTTETYFAFGFEQNLSASRTQELRNNYDAEIRYTDAQLGRLFDTLRAQGRFRDTIIVLTADHAECLGEYNLFDHNRLYWCSLHVPLIVYMPGEGPRRVDDPVSTIDILPTLLQRLGISYSRFVRGEHLLQEDHRRYQYAEGNGGHRLFDYGTEHALQSIRQTAYQPNATATVAREQISERLKKRLDSLGYR